MLEVCGVLIHAAVLWKPDGLCAVGRPTPLTVSVHNLEASRSVAGTCDQRQHKTKPDLDAVVWFVLRVCAVWLSGIVQTAIYCDFFFYYIKAWKNNEKLALPA